eukprot:TRINITY_DN993_c0_g1_i13.p3 TRINITY_DN993_c0_g1~~TRINITY_DN993_c0_g1_i13.p3  ORF type:complete len:199 (+),score=18.40 TRINITY_DN993_c0_g1_i13:102-698(+)
MQVFSICVFFLLASPVLGQTTAIATSVVSATTSTSTTLEQTKTCPSACNNNAPRSEDGTIPHTCEEQKKFGKCDSDFMLGLCECTCDRCCPCNNFPPPGEVNTCKQLQDKGKCGEEFMKGYCECQCERCTGEGSGFVSGDCDTGLVPVYGGDKVYCETKRCAENRQRCANRCGGLTQIEFDCKDTGNSFASSCGCASK